MLGPGPRLIKKKLPGRGLTKFEKHWPRLLYCVVWCTFTSDSRVSTTYFITEEHVLLKTTIAIIGFILLGLKILYLVDWADLYSSLQG